jgi:hypothetical protein
MAEKAVPVGVVTLWNSALGHDVRDFAVAAGSSLLILLINYASNVHLTGQWAQFAIFIPVLVALVKTYFHLKDPTLPNLPTSMTNK